MNIELNKFPLSILNEDVSKSILNQIGNNIKKSHENDSEVIEVIFAGFMGKIFSAGPVVFVDNAINMIDERKARKCLSDLITCQADRVSKNPATFLQEVQLNLMITRCVTDYMQSVDSRSAGNAVKSLGKLAISLIRLQNPLKAFVESAIEKNKKFNSIANLYHIAFLLHLLKTNSLFENEVKSLIHEAMCTNCAFDEERPNLFKDMPSKSLYENMRIRLKDILFFSKKIINLYDPFVKEFEKNTKVNSKEEQ